MADSTTKVLLDVQIKNNQAVERLTELKKVIADNTKELKALDLTKEEDVQKSIKLEAAIRAYKKEASALNKTIDNQIKLQNTASGSNEQLRTQLSLLTAEYNALSAEERENTELGKGLFTAINNTTEALKTNESAVGDNRRNVGAYAEGVFVAIKALEEENAALEENNQQLIEQNKSLDPNTIQFKQNTERIRENEEAIKRNANGLITMKSNLTLLSNSMTGVEGPSGEMNQSLVSTGNTLAGMQQKVKDLQKELQTVELGTPRFEELNKEIKDTNLQIQQTLGNVDEFGNKEPRNLVKKSYEDAAEAAAGLTSVLALANVAFADNENIAQLQAKSLQAIAIAQNVQNIMKARGAIIDVAATIKTKALTIAQAAYALVVGKSTGAMKLFRIALAGTGIGAAVILLGELIFNFKEVNKWVQRGTNFLRDWVSEMTGGNKVVMGFVEVLLLVVSPLATIIRLIADFEGTITGFQNAINGAADAVQNLIGDIPILSDLLEFNQAVFNKVANSIKSLGGTQKKFKVDIQDLSKQYDSFNDNLSRNNEIANESIAIAKAQGKSERDLAAITRKAKQQEVSERQKAYNHAVEVSNKLIQQNGKLNEEQQKLFDKVSDDYRKSQVDLTVFEEEEKQARIEKWKEQAAARKETLQAILDAETDYKNQLAQLEIEFLQTEQERQNARLKLDYENQIKAIDEGLKNLQGSEQDKADAIAAANELKLAITAKYNKDSEKLNKDFADQQEADEKAAYNQSLKGQEDALTKEYNLKTGFANAEISDTKKLEEAKLKIKLEYFQKQLELFKQFAGDNGVLDENELKKIKELQFVIDEIQEKLKEPNPNEDYPFPEGFLGKAEFAVQQISKILGSITDVINADAEYRKEALDNYYEYEKNKIDQSALSQEQKEEKITALNKKVAMEKYNIELEQFRVNKAMNIVNTTIAGILAAMQAYAQLGPIAGAIAAAVLGVTTAAQVGIIAGQPEPPKPQFATGIIGLNGPGSETSDSIDARLSKGESVMTAKATKVFHKHLALMEMAVGNKPNYNPTLGGFAGGLIGDGGFSDRGLVDPVNADLSQQMMVTEVAKQVSKLKVVARISDIDRVAGNVNAVNVSSSIR